MRNTNAGANMRLRLEPILNVSEDIKIKAQIDVLDNLVLGSQGNGIDGAHILTPMPYLISAGKVTQNNVPTPMYILARLNLDAQAISVSNEYKDLKVTANASALKEHAFDRKALGARNLAYERLDQLTVDLLLGVR